MLRRHSVGDDGVGDAAVAVNARDLLDQIRLPDNPGANVQPNIGHGHVERVGFEMYVKAAAQQQVCRLIGANRDAQNALNLGSRQVDLHLRRGQRIVIDDPLRDLTAARAPHQFDAAPHAALRPTGMHAPAEAQPGVGADLLRLHRVADVDEIPVRGFQQHAGGLVADLGLRAADDPADTQDSGFVGHEDGEVVQRALHLVQRFERLARLRQPGDDLGRLPARTGGSRSLDQFVVVEGVGRLPDLEGEVVGHVHDVVDWALPHADQAALHPLWRRLDGGIAQQRQREAWVEFRLADFDADLPGNRRAIRARFVGRLAQRRIQQGGGFPRHAEDAVGAGEVGRQFDVVNHVAQHVLRRSPRRIARILVHKDDALVRVADAEFLLRADHAAVGDAAQRLLLQDHALGFVAVTVPHFRAFQRHNRPQRRVEYALIFVLEQIGRAGDTLLQLIRAIIDHRQHQAVGVRVGFDFADRAQEQLVPIPHQMIGHRVADALDEGLRQADVLDVRDFQPGGG